MSEERRATTPIIEEMSRDISDIKVAILGDLKNEKPGLIGNQAVISSSLSRLWKFVGVIFSCFVGLCFWILRKGV